MDETTKIVDRGARRPRPTTGGDPCLVHIYPTGPAMGARYPLTGAMLLLGRDVDCHIRINEESVSRRHACIQPLADGYCVADLQSTNGTFVNEVRVSSHKLEDGDYLHIGNTIFRYLAGGNVEAEYHEEIYRLTILDALTGAHNKRYLLELLARDLACSDRYHRPLALILFDLDEFKTINDRLGHLGGDYVLRELATCLRPALRKADLFARYGGDEFAVVMPETSREEALEIGERLRRLAQEHAFHYDGQPLAVTISVGVAALTGDTGLTASEILRQADEQLYLAKSGGRNRVAG
jgi:diguanylate cyclase (GGDEF)-like protein